MKISIQNEKNTIKYWIRTNKCFDNLPLLSEDTKKEGQVTNYQWILGTSLIYQLMYQYLCLFAIYGEGVGYESKSISDQIP